MKNVRYHLSNAGARSLPKSFVCGLAAAVLCLMPSLSAQSPAPGMSPRAAFRILEQATWGPTMADAQALQAAGFNTWYVNQLNAPLSPIPDESLVTTAGLQNEHPVSTQKTFFVNALNGKDQLRQRVAFALSEIWVVSDIDLVSAPAFPPILRIYQNRAFGNYLALMKDVTLNPAMGHYLDMANSNKGNPAANTSANENYARELMQLFTIGLNQLHQDGTPVLDSKGAPVPTYTQDTVTNLARMLTGWSYAPGKGMADRINNPRNYLSVMVSHDVQHDMGAKTLFGVNVPAGGSADQDLNQALTILFNQPTLPPFISTQLIQHLVTSNPSPAYVKRVAAAFENNGAGVRGDLNAVIYQILTDPEARSGDSQPFTAAPNFGHFREPILFLTTLMRTLNASLTANSNMPYEASAMNQTLYYPSSVFSYFEPDYQVNGLYAPELQIYDSQAAVRHTTLVNNAIFGGALDGNTKVSLAPFNAAASSGQAQFLNLVNLMFFHNSMSNETAVAMKKAMAPCPKPEDAVKAGLYIALTSGEFQVIH